MTAGGVIESGKYLEMDSIIGCMMMMTNTGRKKKVAGKNWLGKNCLGEEFSGKNCRGRIVRDPKFSV